MASAGILGLVLAFAARKVLGDIMASVQIAFAQTARIGDAIRYDGQWCYVEKIGFTHLRLRTWDERRIIVPVKYFVSRPFENWSVKDARLMKTVRLWLDHAADAEVLRETFETLAKDLDGVIEPESLACFVTDHNEHGQEITCYVMTPDPSTGWEVEMRLREQILAFNRANHPDWWPRERVIGGRHVPDSD